jgi:hypothetical protein
MHVKLATEQRVRPRQVEGAYDIWLSSVLTRRTSNQVHTSGEQARPSAWGRGTALTRPPFPLTKKETEHAELPMFGLSRHHACLVRNAHNKAP